MASFLLKILVFSLVLPINCLALRFSIKELQRDFDKFEDSLTKSIDRVNDKRYQPIKSREIATIKETYNNCNVVRIYCRTNLYLTVVNGKVRGVLYNPADPNFLHTNEGYFQIETYGNSFIRLKDVKSQKYLKMSKRGVIGLTAKKTNETLFFQHLEETGYTTFAAAKYYIYETYDLFISVKRNGKIRLARNTLPGQKSSQFLHITQNDKLCQK